MNTFTAYYDFHFGSLDCVAFGSACTANGVQSFPTFILYRDGEELKRFEGAKDMQGLSKFVEDALETIRPGSRKLGGPELPKTGDKTTKDFTAGEVNPKAAAQD
jgi:protein disulfide-isomerase